jgi:hypothetical protein
VSPSARQFNTLMAMMIAMTVMATPMATQLLKRRTLVLQQSPDNPGS